MEIKSGNSKEKREMRKTNSGSVCGASSSRLNRNLFLLAWLVSFIVLLIKILNALQK